MKTPLLLLHGALGSKRQFKPIIELLSDQYSIHTLDFEGHGGRLSDHPFSIDLFTENVVDYLNRKALEEVSIFGYSMGGYIALNIALRFPHLVKKIITLGTKFDWTEESALKEIKMLNPSIIEDKVPQFAERLAEIHHPLDWKKNMSKTAQMMLDLGQGARLSDAELSTIKQEIIIGVGSLDRMVGTEESEKAARLIEKASLKVLNNVKHPLDQVAPYLVVEYILDNI